ncbi:DNA-directed RNA polymerase subunit alpha [Candidatus Campbellbacteria bacterium RIFCSPLOWO2_02_FULL_35_11]|uniref:DNA-directed RNA polymerase subunit alpha n=2 Tax=Candidatus Campbelliibacteriota TaxID=1752727 RepID=A0A1F5EP27_9BACT|nr:MAG: DNA-directed RNA polymerase subunit alpha [Candidatus Campbellbacteria bacterium RIFCSPHIGHO2_12_FULL_35_10]OGD70430.1 MAG: DNA-directed RNA polymerase subunit alpha [Candidatus Campbellbacteria bacterium RIFCSPLOWO2_02_FULL_35_11]
MLLPSKPRIVEDGDFKGVYEIDGLYPGYGYTLGNSLRRIILSSLPGAAITSVKIDGVDHEFSTISGVKEDVINILLNLKKVRIKLLTDEPQELRIKVKGVKEVTAKDIEVPGQAEVLSPDQHIASITDKSTTLDITMTVVKGLGYISKEEFQKEKVEIGTIALDAFFTPIRRVSYEVENMRVGDRTDFNRLRIFIETDGTVTAKDALEKSIDMMIRQLKAIVGFKEEEIVEEVAKEEDTHEEKSASGDSEFLKTRIETLDLSARTVNALSSANIRTVGGLARKKEDDLLELEGLGSKGLQEIKRALSNFGITLKS